MPAEVFAAPNDQVALFLRHLWATDGCVKWDRRLSKVESSTRRRAGVSRTMSGNCFLRLGISSRAYRVPQGEHREIWHLHISGALS